MGCTGLVPTLLVPPSTPHEELKHRPTSSASSFCPFVFFFFPQVNSLPAERIQEIQKAIELFSVGQGPAKTMEEASKRSYQFWDTQPVPKLGMFPVAPRLSQEALPGAGSIVCSCCCGCR